ncbi:MAG: hypothetical protein HXX11_18400 [Desulfuromonadales bacterium]|nr:hypothetical protein [Desulfuromonadales bacterium]
MKFIQLLILVNVLLLLCSCAIFDTKKLGQSSIMSSNHLVLPVSKNWQAIEEPPKLSNERGRLSFQMEQSVQTKETRPISPEKNRNIDTPRLPTARDL